MTVHLYRTSPLSAGYRLAVIALAVGLAGLSGGCKKGKQTQEPVTELAASAVPAAESEQEASPAQPTDTLLISYSRTHCFGMCPVFDCLIYESGYALYRGINFVDYIGFYHTQFDPAALQKILSVARDIGYFGLDDVYDEPYVTDLPSVITGIRNENGRKNVVSRYNGPASLRRLHEELDRLLATARWNRLERSPAPWSQE